MSEYRLSYRDRWLSTVCDLRTDARRTLGDRESRARQPGSFRVVMAVLAMYADHETGTNARPSLRRLQHVTRYKHATVRAALALAESAGFITSTGTWVSPSGGDPITVWALGYPSAEGFRPWNDPEAVSPLDGVTDPEAVSPLDGVTASESTRWSHRPESGESTGRNSGESTGRNSGESTGWTTTPSTPSRPLGSEGGRESADAPPPDGGALTRLPVAKVRDIITAVIPEQAQAGINCGNVDLGDAVTTVLARGWTVDALAVVLADMVKAKNSPTGQAISRLRALADTDPQAVILPTTTTTTSTATADVFAEQDQQAVRLFCKWTGADREPLAATLAKFVGRGLRVEADLYRDNYSNFTLDLPDLTGDTFWIDWEAFDGMTDYGHEKCNVIRACFDGLPLTDAERKALAKLGTVKYKPEIGDFEVSTDRPSIAALRRFVDVAYPIALAVATRGLQPPPEPARATGNAKPTPTPRAVAEVLADDPRQPGADGFAHFDPPGRATHRPPGHDQAVRQADDLERKRQQRALADIDDPAILEALAALQANGIPTDPPQENPA